MNKIRFRLVYNRKKKLNKHGKALIQVEVYQNRKKNLHFIRNLCKSTTMGQLSQ